MDSLIASYGNASDESESESDSVSESPTQSTTSQQTPIPHLPLPPPPLSLLNPPNSIGQISHQPSKVRTFAHVDGNYALHVYIPVYVPQPAKKAMTMLLKRVSRAVTGLYVVDVDVPLDILREDEAKLEQVALGREFHISLGRTVPIRVHQIDSVVTMLRRKFQLPRRFSIDFSSWEVFVNDEGSRTFLSCEVTGAGLTELRKQIQAVNEVYRLHNLPEFYKDPRPHISLAWGLGDISNSLKSVVQQERTCIVGKEKTIFSTKFCGIECRIGNKTYKICDISDK